ncbi:AfsR/SARP family transcriptional regulator [Actinophytocola sp. KF-1]
MLGPIEVSSAGRPVALGGGRDRLLLAALLLNADQLTLTSQLIALLWERPPTTAKAQVHNMISRLRKRLGDGTGDLILSRPGGYELRLRGHELDLVEFRALVEKGRQARADGRLEAAVRTFDEALALWRGPALADIAEDFAQDTRHALHEELLAAAEAQLSAELALGRHDDVLRRVATLIVDHPYRERLHEIKMLALAGAGRRADALAAYQDAYRRLVEDLGVEPGPPLRRLEQRILNGDHVVAPPAPARVVPRQLPPVTAVIAGRDELIGEVCATLRTPTPSGRVVVLVGPGGVGKTTVALAAAHAVGDDFPDGQLYADLRGTHQPADPHVVVGRLLRDMGVDGAALPDDRDERVAMYRGHLAQRRLLVVLDDAASEAQVRPLLPGAASCGAVVTSRRQLAALAGPARWTVPVPAPEAAAQVLARVVGAERVAREPDAAAAIADLCGHLPLAVCIAAARLSVHPEWTLAHFRRRLAEQRGRLDELAVGDLDVRASIELSYQALDPPLRGLFRRLALIAAPDWPAWVAHRLLDATGGGPVEPVLDQLVDTHLVEPLGRDAFGQPRFRLHDLVADFGRERAAAEDEPATLARAQSAMLTGWLVLATEADERLDHGMAFAADLALPADAGPAPAVAEAVRRAPAEWFEAERVALVSAVNQACRLGDGTLAGTIALRIAGFLALRSYEDDREHTLNTAIVATEAHGHEDMLVRLLGALFAMRSQRDQYGELPAIAAAELAVARRLGDQEREFQALNHAGRAARMLDRFTDAADALDQALELARRGAIQPRLRCRVLNALANLHTDLGEPERAVELIEEAVELGDTVGGRTMAILLRDYGLALMDVGRHPEAERALEKAYVTARALEDDRGTAWVEQAQADLDIRLGRWADAEARLDRSLRVQQEVGDREGVGEVLRSRGDLEAGRATPAQAVEPLRQSLEIWRALGAALQQARTLARMDLVFTALGENAAAEVCRRDCADILAELKLGPRSLRLPR